MVFNNWWKQHFTDLLRSYARSSQSVSNSLLSQTRNVAFSISQQFTGSQPICSIILDQALHSENVIWSRIPPIMAQKSLRDETLEIDEFDQANNLIARYIKSPSTDSGSRIDVIVRSPFIQVC
jgi:hypothetical protein